MHSNGSLKSIWDGFYKRKTSPDRNVNKWLNGFTLETPIGFFCLLIDWLIDWFLVLNSESSENSIPRAWQIHTTLSQSFCHMLLGQAWTLWQLTPSTAWCVTHCTHLVLVIVSGEGGCHSVLSVLMGAGIDLLMERWGGDLTQAICPCNISVCLLFLPSSLAYSANTLPL